MTEKTNYIDEVAGRIGVLLPDCDTELLRLYALLALTCGVNTTLENVHDAWAAWRAATRPDHPSLVPFAELAPQVQELDRKYADAIRAVADPYGGHEFHYEPHTDLFRCIRCHAYEVTARAEDGSIAPCTGEPPEGAGAIEVNAW